MAKPNTFLFLLISSLLILPTFLEANGNHHHHKKKHHSPPYDGYDYSPEFGDPGFGVGSPGWSGGYGGGYGGPSGSSSWSGVQRGWTVCKNRGRCYKRKLKCPNKCFHKWSKSGKHYGSGGGSGSCTLDCRRCRASC